MSTTPNHEKSVAPVRLNLGCGDKILPDYINNDIVSARKEKSLTLLPILEIYEISIADEMLAVHMIEHFYYWEVIPLLTSWKRILKPGGKIILECPNLLYACKMLLENPSKASSADQNGQMSMWPLYGDPSWKDPLICHKWAYTPESLANVLTQSGYSNTQQEAAKYKLREPRDMRITGIKPY